MEEEQIRDFARVTLALPRWLPEEPDKIAKFEVASALLGLRQHFSRLLCLRRSTEIFSIATDSRGRGGEGSFEFNVTFRRESTVSTFAETAMTILCKHIARP